MSVLTREQILAQAKKPRQIEKVSVPEWGGEVNVRELLGRERDEFEISLSTMDRRGKVTPKVENVRAKLLAWTICDDNGIPLFNPDNGDVEELGSIGASSLTRLFVVARRLSAFDDEDIKELTTNLGNARSADSGSV
jgi:hypothetical protein